MPIFISKDNQQSGPYEDHVVIEQLKSGMLSPNDMAIRHGAAAWQRLGAMFPGIGVSKPSPPVAAAAAASVGAAGTASAAPIAKKGGCLKAGLIGVGLLMLLFGVTAAIGSRFIPSVSCDLAESDARKIEKLRSDIDKATKNGDFDKIGPLQIELQSELAGAETTQRYCNDDKFRNNIVAAGGGALAFVGFLMAIVGLFVGRGRKAST